MSKSDPKFKVGNVVSVHFSDPQSIGYNGTCHTVSSVSWYEPWQTWRYCLKSINGHGYIYARESEMTFQAERYVEPYYGQCIIEIGD